MKHGLVRTFFVGISFLSVFGVSSGYSEPQKRDSFAQPTTSIGTYVDYGKLLDGGVRTNANLPVEVKEQIFTRQAAWLKQSQQVSPNMEISVGVGALLWYPVPDLRESVHTRLMRFRPSVEEAVARYSFGNTENPYLKLHMGLFGYKYNPDAKNLGEYLFRSGTYPGYLWTGGWSVLNSAAYKAQGLRGELKYGSFTLDVGFYIEGGLQAKYNISPSIVGSYQYEDVLEVGAGVVFAHYIDLNSNVTTPKDRKNGYYFDNESGQYRPVPNDQQLKPGLDFYGYDDPKTDTLIVRATDPRYGQSLSPENPRYNVEQGVTRYLSEEDNGIPNNQIQYYTFKGEKLMARANVKLPALFGKISGNSTYHIFGKNDLKLYGEVALLGVKDYPFYYANKRERMPVMGGVGLPTFKPFFERHLGFSLIDDWAFEVEYYKNSFPNSIEKSFQEGLPIPGLFIEKNPGVYTEVNADEWVDSNYVNDVPNINWSFWAHKKISKGMQLYVQVAHDHLRVMDFGAAPSYEPFARKKGWYWITRLQFNI